MHNNKMHGNKKFLGVKWFFAVVLLGMTLLSCVSEKVGGDKVIDKKKSLDLHVQMALGYIDKGNRESARHHLKKAFELNSTYVPATGAMAMLYQLEGEPALAEDEFKLALKRDKKFTLGHNNYGIFLFNQKRYEEAYVEFEKAASDLEFNNRAQTLNNVGRAALKLGNVARAQAAFEHASILDKKNSEGFIELADIHFQKQEYAEAKQYIDLYESTADHSARSLLLAIRLERIFSNKDKEASLALALKSRFPYSKEYLDYKQNNLN